MAGVRVVTDSSCDLPADLVAREGIEVVPLTIRFGSDEFVDGRDLTPEEFWSRCATATALPETAAPAPGAFEEAFRRQAAAGADAVVCIVLSTKLSATGQSAMAAANAMAEELPVKVLDSKSVSLGLGLLVLEAARMGAEGSSLDEITSRIESLAGAIEIHAALDTLDHLRKGGRVGGAQALIGGLLSIKPVIEVRDGAVEPGPKLRTRARATAYLAEKVASAQGLRRLAVVHGEAPDLEAFLETVSAQVPRDQIVVGNLGPVVGTHTGPGTLGVIISFEPAGSAS